VALADAVRRATVSAQALRAMGQRKHREIRYDLLPDLRRKRDLSPDEFMDSVAGFVSRYNAENARRRELRLQDPQIPQPPRNITTDEFRSFAALVETCGASKVGGLLRAFGTCLSPPDSEPEPGDTSAVPDATPGADSA